MPFRAGIVYGWHVIRFRAMVPKVEIKSANGTTREFRPADTMKEWIPIAQSHNEVAKVFTILAKGLLEWVDLYRILEIVKKDAGGIDAIAAAGWATKKSIERLKHTSNSPDAIGLDARHGVQDNQPPTRPMAISEA